MTPTKLSDSDKREIIRLYRQSDENTITLAKRYGVSSSTVRRLVQSALSESEYESCVQQKQKRLPDRTGVAPPIARTVDPWATDSEVDAVSAPISQSVPVSQPSAANSRPTIRQRFLSGAEPVAPIAVRGALQSDLDVSQTAEAKGMSVARRGGDVADRGDLKAMLPEEGLLADEDFSDFDEDRDDEDDADSEDLEDEDALFEASLLGLRSSGESIGLGDLTLIQVLPLGEASLPKICYLVVDRAAELIARPLKAFGELGQIPAIETREKTLPVFDNHRVARRFATRHQRVVKVPDGKLLQKAAPYLQAKGITRLLIDGQVYSLS